MEREDVLSGIKRYFDTDELVCNHLMKHYSANMGRCWDFLDDRFLENLLIIRRDILKSPMYCNNLSAGTYQRGIRCNLCELVKEKDRPYLSAHVLGKGGDFTVVGMTAHEAREKIKENAHLLPHPLRMEADVTWLHIDVMPTPNGKKVYEFKE